MSDAQLKRVNNRLNMEKQYSQLTALPPSKAQAATKFMTNIAVNVARTQMTSIANDVATAKVAEIMSAKGVGTKGLKLPKNIDPTKAWTPPKGRKFL